MFTLSVSIGDVFNCRYLSASTKKKQLYWTGEDFREKYLYHGGRMNEIKVKVKHFLSEGLVAITNLVKNMKTFPPYCCQIFLYVLTKKK